MMMMRKSRDHQNTAPSSPLLLSMHNTSQTISKKKPKIRIIHIFAPEIIKTDAANFRELVQRLTGKPTTGDHNLNCSKVDRVISTTRRRRVDDERGEEPRKLEQGGLLHAEAAAAAAAEEEGFGERVEEEDEEEIWRDANSGGGFLGGFSEFDHFPYI